MVDEDKDLGQARLSSKTPGHIVPDDSCYLGLALRFRIRSKALMAYVT